MVGLDCPLLPFGPGAEFVNHPPDFGHHVYVFVGHARERFGQHLDFVLQADVAIDDAVHFALDQANAALHRYAAGPKTLFGHGHAQFFRQILKILIYLLWFHGTRSNISG